jgi:hypothetical protein
MRWQAVHMREEGGTVREIAEALDVPVATVGDWVLGVDPLPHAGLTDEPANPDAARLAMLRATCSRCQELKPWLDFWAKAKWPDDTMRLPQSWCKDCVKAERRQRRKKDPEWASRQDKANWQKIKADPVKLAKRRELTRENGRVHRLRKAEEVA